MFLRLLRQVAVEEVEHRDDLLDVSKPAVSRTLKSLEAKGFVNGWFWRRYAVLTQEQYNAVIAAQRQVYHVKTSFDLCVVVATAAVAVATDHPATHYVDVLGSVSVAAYLLWTGLRTVQPHRASTRAES